MRLPFHPTIRNRLIRSSLFHNSDIQVRENRNSHQHLGCFHFHKRGLDHGTSKYGATILGLAASTLIAKPGGILSYSTNKQSRISRIGKPLEWSYLSVKGQTELQGMTVGQAVDRAEDLFGDRQAVVSVYQNIRKTFSELRKDARATAAGLVAAGLQPGDRLGLWSPNSYQWVVTQFAAAMAGLVLVNINPAYLPSELQYCLNKVSVKALVCSKSFRTSDYYSILCSVAPELSHSSPGRLSSSSLPHLRTVIFVSPNQLSGTLRFQDLPSMGSSEHTAAIDRLATTIQFDSPTNIQFTSGTTGSPKAAMLSHHNIVNNAFAVGRRLEYDEAPHRICVSVPLYHCFGCVGATLTATLYGATCVLPAEGFSGRACVDALVSEDITSCYGTPTMFVDIMDVARKQLISPPPSLITGAVGGAPCPPQLIYDIIKLLNMKQVQVLYGMTETSPLSFQSFPNDPPEVRATTIGFPTDNIEVKVVDGKGQVARVGEEGELCIRGYSVFLGYWGDPSNTQEVLGPDRWFKTGDLATMDEHGYGRISGRKTDMINRGGENIYPAELENFFMTHPAVREAQVFSVPDPRLGDDAAVWLRLQDGAALTERQFRDWCSGKISAFKIPRYVLFKTSFPSTVTGKIQKFKMREETIRELDIK